MNVAQLLGIDNENYTEEQRAHILSLFNGLRQKALESKEEALGMVKLVLKSPSELIIYRNQLAENGIEYTPAELETIVRITKAVLLTV